jgi:molybdenum cofactor cytidylyltransferase
MQGATKQLLRWGDATLIRNAVEIAQASNASEIVVVTGNRAVEVEAQVQGTAARVVLNPEWASGRASSVRTGIDALDGKTGAAIFMNADQPFLAGAILDRLIASFESTLAPVVVPVYQGQPGSPVLFARTLFGVLRALQGDRGGREVLNEYRDVMQRVEIEDAHAALDLDTPAEYDAAVAQQVRMDDTRRA